MSQPQNFLTGINPTWCAGCGNFGIWAGVRKALQKLNQQPHQLALFHDIGCCGNGANWYNTYGFHSLHGRALPAAVGAKLANHKLVVLALLGDGGGYGEGGNHFIHTCRTNINLTMVVHNNKLYSLTTGQVSPTSKKGTKTKSTPSGSLETDFEPLQTAIVNGATFVARSYADDIDHVSKILEQAVLHQGFSLVDILQPCPTFNKDNTRQWYQDKIYKLEAGGWQPNDKNKAIAKAAEWGSKIPIGIFYQEKRLTFESQLPQLKEKTLVEKGASPVDLKPFLDELK